MSDLISRQAAIEAIHEDADWLAAQGSDWQVERMERDKSILKSLPSVQSDLDSAYQEGYTAAEAKYRAIIDDMKAIQTERKKGKWIEKEYSPFYCSVCGTYQYSASWEIKNKEYNFCPRCGADMRGESDEN